MDDIISDAVKSYWAASSFRIPGKTSEIYIYTNKYINTGKIDYKYKKMLDQYLINSSEYLAMQIKWFKRNYGSDVTENMVRRIS